MFNHLIQSPHYRRPISETCVLSVYPAVCVIGVPNLASKCTFSLWQRLTGKSPDNLEDLRDLSFYAEEEEDDCEELEEDEAQSEDEAESEEEDEHCSSEPSSAEPGRNE